uniref:Spermatogenesis-associated protein 1 C-terminal domain-containing protein n=1 Tax=Ciona intestinalis TaxID=7719 RepID=H2XJY5_CIOIN
NDDSGYVDVERSASEASTHYIHSNTRDPVTFRKNEAAPAPRRSNNEEIENSPTAKRRSKPQKQAPLHEAAETHTPSPITIPVFKKPPIESRDLLDSSQSSVRNVAVNNNKSNKTEKESKVKRETGVVKTTKQNDKRSDSASREKLWSELQRARTDRRNAENKRQELVRQAKMTTSKMNQKRTSVRDIWKKKFFEQKKKTMPLTDVSNRLQQEYNKLHHRLVSVMEGQKALGQQKVQVLPITTVLPSVKNNTKIQVTRFQHDIDNLRQKIEDAKIKLTGEIKLRHHADENVKVVRQELLSKKIQAHIAYRGISGKPGLPAIKVK